MLFNGIIVFFNQILVIFFEIRLLVLNRLLKICQLSLESSIFISFLLTVYFMDWYPSFQSCYLFFFLFNVVFKLKFSNSLWLSKIYCLFFKLCYFYIFLFNIIIKLYLHIFLILDCFFIFYIFVFNFLIKVLNLCDIIRNRFCVWIGSYSKLSFFNT